MMSLPLSEFLRPPDGLRVKTDDGGWSDGNALVKVGWDAGEGKLSVWVEAAPGVGLRRVRLRWRARWPAGALFLGDAFERSYGELGWGLLRPERVMPWYFLLGHHGMLSGLGVQTGAGAFAAWMADGSGLTLDLDCRCGGEGVHLGTRRLDLATLVARDGVHGECPHEAARAFCRRLCPQPRLPRGPVFGVNTWYSTYGFITASGCIELAQRAAEWAAGEGKAFLVVDDGWQAFRSWSYNGGPWRAGGPGFENMADLAEAIRQAGARPGIWYRPLLQEGLLPPSWALRAPRPHGFFDHGVILDPSHPEAAEFLAEDLRRLVSWGFEFIKHDFTTYDVLGWWGRGVPGPWIEDGWSFADRSRTSAEILRAFYGLLRDAAGEALLLGCNTVGHLAAGSHELHRAGDDTSGRTWERTRRMGINALAFRMPQHETFFALDPDCVGLTSQVPWFFNRQWLELTARAGTPLFISPELEAIGPEQHSALRNAFAAAAQSRKPGKPLDWMQTSCPELWEFADGEARFDWTGGEGCPPPEEPIP